MVDFNISGLGNSALSNGNFINCKRQDDPVYGAIFSGFNQVGVCPEKMGSNWITDAMGPKWTEEPKIPLAPKSEPPKIPLAPEKPAVQEEPEENPAEAEVPDAYEEKSVNLVNLNRWKMPQGKDLDPGFDVSNIVNELPNGLSKPQGKDLDPSFDVSNRVYEIPNGLFKPQGKDLDPSFDVSNRVYEIPN